MSDEQAAGATPVAPTSIQAGGESYTISKFKGYKAFRIGRMLAGLGEIGPAVSKSVNQFTQTYREENADVIERATLEFRYPGDAAAVSEEAWKESGGVIRLAREPSQAEVLAVVLPTVFELVGDKIADLLAWVIADDGELEKADGESEEAVEAYIESLRKKLLFQAGIDELFDLAVGAQDVLKDQMQGKAEAARSLLALVGLDPEAEEETDSESDPMDETPKAASPEFVQEKEETPSTPESTTSSEKPDSSTDSPSPTDGPESESSTAPTGEPSPSISG